MVIMSICGDYVHMWSFITYLSDQVVGFLVLEQLVLLGIWIIGQLVPDLPQEIADDVARQAYFHEIQRKQAIHPVFTPF